MHTSRRNNSCRLILLCLSLIFVSMLGRPALAQSNPWTIQETVPSLSNSLTYVVWVKSGTTNANGSYSGDTASIWTVDATGHQMAVSPTYGPYTGWHADELVPAFDGSLRMAWTQNSGTTVDTSRNIVSFWTLDSTANLTAISPTYGPYSGWHFYEIFPNPDGTSAVYWANNTYDSSGALTANQLSIWTVDNVGSQLSISPTYGPYTGWYFLEGIPSFNKDGTSFVAWVNKGTTDSNNNYSGDEVSVWKTDSRGSQTSVGPVYGRYPGWQFNELYPAYDGTARLLWMIPGTYDSSGSYSGDTASVWSLDSTGHQAAVGPVYGPYAGWTVDSIIAAPSSTSRLLWILPGTYDNQNNYTGDLASIWSLNAADVQTSISPTYTSPGGMASGGLDVMPDGSERLEWEYGNGDSGIFSLWALDASNNHTATGPTYGPYN